ncbi:BREX protein BrxB domain-containing protein [Oceanobacillus oncorhynchi]|uniref:BREX protein BrxB domain-containing protein n=1 Tax=Oceanobacillus TaxID=182709 RepID=UPI003CD0A150
MLRKTKLFITNIGKSVPMIRALVILNNLHTEAWQIPVMLNFSDHYDNQNHQCELVVCSAAEGLCYRPRPKRPTEWFPFCTTLTDSKRIFYFFLFFSPVNESNSSNNVN